MAATEEIEKEILAEMAANPVPYAAGQVNDVITIDGETRMISVPASEIFFGVESDKDVERKHFRCPKKNYYLSSDLKRVSWLPLSRCLEASEFQWAA